MKRFFILFLLTASCSRPSYKMKTIDWSSESGQPMSVELETIQGKNISFLYSKYGQTEIQNQEISGIEVDGAFLKKNKNTEGQLTRVQGQFEAKKISVFHNARWNLARKNKFFVLKGLRKNNQFLENKEIQSFDLKLVSKDDQLVPFWFLKYFETSGELWQSTFSYRLKLISNIRLGSAYDVTPAWVYPKGPKYGDLQQVYLLDLMKGDELISKSLKVTSADNTKVQVSGQPLQFIISDQRFDQVQSFYLSQKTLDWFEKNFNVQYPAILDLQIHVGAPEKTNTAFYYQGHVRLGAGDDIIYSKIPWDPSIVTHESSHFIIDLLAHLPFDGEGGSLNEAFADYFAASILDNPLLGESSYLQGPCKRRIDLIKKFSEKTGGLYADSIIVSSLLWELNKKLGSAKGLMLAFKTLQNLNPQSNFNFFRLELIKQMHQDLELPDQLTVANILRNRDWEIE